MTSRWLQPPFSVVVDHNEHGEPRWRILDSRGLELADTGYWPPAAEQRMREVLEQMVAAVNEPAAVRS